MMRRVVAGLVGGTANNHQRMVELIQESTKHFDADHVRYLIERDIIPGDLLPDRLRKEADRWMLEHVDLALSGYDREWQAAACEARPDCRELLETPRGQAWLKRMVSP